MAAAGVSVLVTLAIIGSLVVETVRFFGDVRWTDYFFGTKWTPLFAGDQQSFGVLPLIYGTLYLSLIALLVAVPLGLLSAIYLAEYAPPRVRRTVKPILETLAGVPTIVFGYFALTFFTPEIPARVLHADVNQFNALSAGIIMGLLVLPTIASVAEDAMSAVPYAARGRVRHGRLEAHRALRIVFPAALSGIVAALILGASRAVGETVIVLIAGGQTASMSGDPRKAIRRWPAFIAATVARRHPDGSIEY
jgi:phosphate transport system permease protein